MITSIQAKPTSTPVISANHDSQKPTDKVDNKNVLNFKGISLVSSNALKSNGINMARSLAFKGSIFKTLNNASQAMRTCQTEKPGSGEEIGKRVDVKGVIGKHSDDFVKTGDLIATTVPVGKNDARASLEAVNIDEKAGTKEIKLQMDVLNDQKEAVDTVAITLENPQGKTFEAIKENPFIVDTKGNLTGAIKDGNNVIMTNSGHVEKKVAQGEGKVKMEVMEKGNKYRPFTPEAQPVVERKVTPSIGEGTNVIIGMEHGRFTNEIKASIKEFERKINNEEIILPQFKAAPNAKDTQLMMLAGGFGSRAEHTNIPSAAIRDGEIGGAQSTKGVHRGITGLTPMETTFITLHKAGLLDCSKGKFGIGKNIHFYENQGQNRGNGEFSADLYETMKKDGIKSAMIFPNDSMSRMTNAVTEANKIMGSGKAAIVMIAKEVKAEDCIKNFGIMKLSDDNEILGFAEKPAVIPEGYERDGMCLTNTFQFAVSDEAFEVLNKLEPYFIVKPGEKESRDWSKQYTPIIKTLTQDEDLDVVRENLAKSLNNEPENITDDLIKEMKGILGDQKIYAVPTAEPWADCGKLNQLYDTQMQIVSGNFPLEDFERARALECVDTQTGLMASSPEQLKDIQEKYNVEGQVMVVPEAVKVTDEEVADVPVTIHKD